LKVRMLSVALKTLRLLDTADKHLLGWLSLSDNKLRVCLS
jgi:hypothetical protein